MEREDVELVGVQHHHAHLAACLAEHGEPGPAVGAIFDGTGYGTDGTVWGGELLLGDLARLPPGGHADAGPAAGRRAGGPAAVADGLLVAGRRRRRSAEPHAPALRCAGASSRAPGAQVRQLVAAGVGSPLTTSMGRLFDAVAALSGVRAEVNYEGQAAIELEAACDPASAGAIRSPCPAAPSCSLLDPRETIRAVAADARRASRVGVIARRFHAAVAARDRRGLRRRAASAHGTELRGARRRRVPESPAAGVGGGRAARGGPARADPRAPADERRRDRLRAGGRRRGAARGPERWPRATPSATHILGSRCSSAAPTCPFGELTLEDARRARTSCAPRSVWARPRASPRSPAPGGADDGDGAGRRGPGERSRRRGRGRARAPPVGGAPGRQPALIA